MECSIKPEQHCALRCNRELPEPPFLPSDSSQAFHLLVAGDGLARLATVVNPLGKRGVPKLGRSRGGFGTKIHLKTDFDGLPIAFDLTGGHAADSPQFKTLRDLGPASSLRTRPVTALETANAPGKKAP